MTDVGRGAYLELRNRVVPVVDQMVENSPNEKVAIHFSEIKKRIKMNYHSLYDFFERCKGVEVYGTFAIIAKSTWREVKLNCLYTVDPSEAIFVPFV